MSDRVVTTVTLALNLIDAYSGKRPVGWVKVSLEDWDVKCIKNPSGYYVFTNIPRADYRVRVESEFYFEIPGEDSLVKVSELDELNPVKTFTLNPRPSYPFSSGTTLIRGMVYKNGKKPVHGAEVKITDPGLMSFSNIAETTEDGEFVLYFKGLTDDEITKKDGIRFLKVVDDDGEDSTAVSLEAVLGSQSGMGVLEKAAEARTNILKESIILE